MLLPGDNSLKSWLFVTILAFSTIALSESSGGKKLDIKLGFDLTQWGIGAPSLRIRDFQDAHEYNPRALEGETSNDESASEKKIAKPSSEENQHKKEELDLKPEKSDDDDGDDDDKNSGSGEDDTVRVTRGPKTGDFEPEEDNPKIHAKYAKNSESDHDDEEDGRRYKRHIERFGNVAKRR